MAKVEYSGFRGITPRNNPALLDANVAQVAHNAVLWHRDLRALRGLVDVVTPAARGSAIRTIYRMGQSLGETQHWLAWTTDVDVVTGIIADDPDERTFYTGDGPPKVTTLPLAVNGGSSFPVASYQLGLPRPTGQMFGEVTKLFGSTGAGFGGLGGGGIGAPFGVDRIYENRVYVVTYVSVLGEEGAPGTPLRITAPTECEVTISNLPGAPQGNYNIVSKRLYRMVVTGANQGSYFFEAEIPISQSTFVSTQMSTALNEELTTLKYDPPPADLQGLVAMPNGILAGFSGYDIYFSEPYLPYAWPNDYRMTADYPIVGLGVFGATLVVLTKGVPYLVNGSHPDSMSMDKVALQQSCVSKKSIVSVGNGVVYAAPDGLAYVGAGTPALLTEAQFTKDEWKALPITSIKGYWYDGKYIAIHDAGGFIINSIEDKELVTFDSAGVTAGYVDLRTDELYLCIANSIKRFNAGASLTYTWRGPKVTANMRPAPMCAKVEADAYPVTFKLFADGVLKHTQQVADSKTFRLPAGFRPRELEMELSGTAPIRWAGWADSPEEFRNG